MTRRCVTVALTEPSWTPPGVSGHDWRRAMAEDVVDLLGVLSDVDVAIAATDEGAELADAIRWPGTRLYRLPGRRAAPVAALTALARDGYQQGLVLAPDMPDMPALLVGKLFRPLTTRAVALAPVLPDRPGLIGVAARLPVPGWLAEADPDLATATPDELRTAARAAAGAGSPTGVTVAPGWHRLRGPDDLGLLDVALEGWEATRLLLSADGA